MPVRHARSEIRGRPPFGRGGGIGKNGSIRIHNASGSNAAAMSVHVTCRRGSVLEVLLQALRRTHMYILVHHTISDPATAWSRAQAALPSVPAHLKLHHSIPTPDGSTAVCVWEADSITTLKRISIRCSDRPPTTATSRSSTRKGSRCRRPCSPPDEVLGSASPESMLDSRQSTLSWKGSSE